MKAASIQLRKKTRDRLRRYGVRGETWDQLVNRILDSAVPRKQADMLELDRRRKEDEYIPLDDAIRRLNRFWIEKDPGLKSAVIDDNLA